MKKTILLYFMGLFAIICLQSSYATDFYNSEFGLNNRTKHFQGIAFVPGNKTNVVAVAQIGCIWHSSDNGANWRQVRGPVYENPLTEGEIPTNDSTLNGVGFVDENIGFACGGTKNVVSLLFYTNDGGLTWTDISSQLPADILTKGLFGIHTVDASTVYIYGYSGTLVKARKNGSDWSFVKKVTVGAGTADVYGFAFGGTANTAFAALQSAKLYTKTSIDDDESAWSQVVYTPGWGTMLIWDVKFVDANNGLIVGNSGKILKTTDGGATWTEMTSGVTNHLRRIVYDNAMNVYVIGQQGTILESLDGGSTWAKANSNSVRALNALDIKNGQILVVSFHGGVLSSPAQIPNGLSSVTLANVSIYPSYVSEFLNIETEENIISAEVFELTGKSLYTTSKSVNSIFVGDLEKGIYFVRIKTDKGEMCIKFVKI